MQATGKVTFQFPRLKIGVKKVPQTHLINSYNTGMGASISWMACWKLTAQGPDEIPVEAWIALGNKGVEFLVNFFNRLLRGEKIPDEWRRSVLVPLCKGKGDIKNMKITGGSSR